MRKIHGCKTRIRRAEEKLSIFKRNRGKPFGTFWMNIKAVDKEIEDQEKIISGLYAELEQLKKSEITGTELTIEP